MPKKILVLGATGHVGRPLVRALVAKGEAVKAASRSGAPVEGAEGAVLDLADPTTFGPALDGVDRLFALAPTGTVDPKTRLLPLITAAAARQVKVVLMTAFGVDADDQIPFRQLELALMATGTPFVILRPNWFADNFVNYWKGGLAHGVISVPAGEGRTSFIDAHDIAESAAAALTTTRFDGQAFPLTGPEALSYGDAAALLSEALGKPVAYQPVDDETFIALLTNVGVEQDYARFLASIFHPVREGWAAPVTDAVETLTGHKPRSLKTYVQDHAALLK